MSVICSFFGHRTVGNEIRYDLYDEIERHITQQNTDTFYVGNYGHFDRMASDILNEMKRRYPHILVYRILAYMPTREDREADEVQHPTLYPEGLELIPRQFAISHRNRWIVNESDYIIGYVLTNYGGAYEAMRYAAKKNKIIVNLARRGYVEQK